MPATSRRRFIKTAATGTALLAASSFPFEAFAQRREVKLTILHTNDVHSRIEPFPMDGSRAQGLGGAARRAALIRQIRSEADNVLLLDAGDIFQGTPYFNIFGGELELKLMSQMGYDAATMGNHDFDNGIEGFVKQLPHANFPIITSNYDFTGTLLEGKTMPYKIFRKQGIKIGVFGLGIKLEGLVDPKNYGNTIYRDPVDIGNRTAAELRSKGCQFVICLSHLGYKYEGDKISDTELAPKTRNIDLIIGGHTHTFLDAPVIVNNLDNKPVAINQVGWSGINLGRLDYVFGKTNSEPRMTSAVYKIGEEQGEV